MYTVKMLKDTRWSFGSDIQTGQIIKELRKGEVVEGVGLRDYKDMTENGFAVGIVKPLNLNPKKILVNKYAQEAGRRPTKVPAQKGTAEEEQYEEVLDEEARQVRQVRRKKAVTNDDVQVVKNTRANPYAKALIEKKRALGLEEDDDFSLEAESDDDFIEEEEIDISQTPPNYSSLKGAHMDSDMQDEFSDESYDDLDFDKDEDEIVAEANGQKMQTQKVENKMMKPSLNKNKAAGRGRKKKQEAA